MFLNLMFASNDGRKEGREREELKAWRRKKKCVWKNGIRAQQGMGPIDLCYCYCALYSSHM